VAGRCTWVCQFSFHLNPVCVHVPFQENTKGIQDEEKRQRWSNERKKKVKETFQIKKRNNGLLRKENLPPR
jgi:hypothetical protein